jgi:hypothetical protein
LPTRDLLLFNLGARMFKTKVLPTIAAGMMLLCLANSAVADVVLYSQPPLVYPPGQFPPGAELVWSSMPFPASPGFAGGTSLAYDNFRVSTPSQINSVTWEGGYFGPPTQVPITNFALTFYTDAGGKPGTALATASIPFASANQTNLHNETGVNGANILVADYSANLPNSFLANSNTPYWLSIQANIPGYGANQATQWGWHIGQGGDGVSIQDFLGAPPNAAGIVRPTDQAFSLVGIANVIPEPTSLAVWGVMGLAGLGYCRHRRKAQTV